MSDSRITYHELALEDAKQWMDAMKPGEFTLLDVRTQKEYESGYMKGAILIPDYELATKMNDRLPHKEKPIFVYSRSGIRSKKAAKLLADAGYRKVYELGGIINWNYALLSYP